MITLPVLPAGSFDFNPAASDTTVVSALEIAYVPGGYDAFRPHGFSPVTAAISGPGGRAVLQLLYTPAL
jgi:hypothetical protein